MVETNPELQSSITCFRQVVPSSGLEKFLVSANTIARDLFGQREKFYVKLPDTLFDLGLVDESGDIKPQYEDIEDGDVMPNMQSASVDIATTFRSRSLRSTLYSMHGSASFEFNNALWRSYSRITAESIRASSRLSRTPTGKKSVETRPNTIMRDARAVQEKYYMPGISEIEVIINGIEVVETPSLEGTLFGLDIERGSLGAEILVEQQQVLISALSKMVAVRNAAKLSDKENQPSPLTIPFAYVPFRVNGEGEIFIDEVGKLARSHVPTIDLASPKWKFKPVSV